MRVLDPPVTQTAFSMGKKKHKLRKLTDTGLTDGSSEDISLAGTGCAETMSKMVSDNDFEEGIMTPRLWLCVEIDLMMCYFSYLDPRGRGCQHIQKAVSLATIRKGIRGVTVGQCTDCASEDRTQTRPEEDEETETTVWLCLQCGHQGCDRNSSSKHALKHYQTPRSASHSLAVNTTSWLVWCYECDEEVLTDSSKRLSESVDFIRRHAGLPTQAETILTGNNSPVNTPTDGAQAPPRLSQTPPTTPRPVNTASLNAALPRVKGLSNLGNTCFFNAVLQNLSQTHELDGFLREHIKAGTGRKLVAPPSGESESDSEEEGADNESRIDSLGPIDVVVPEAGSLTQSLASFLKDMSLVSKNNILSPSLLFGQICKKTPRFKGFQQQDSHELLRHLLDGMKSEEVKRCQMGILRHFNLPENVNPKKVDDDMKAKIKEYGRVAKSMTFVDSIFGGHLISTVVCEVCQAASQIYEPFLDLSLPLNEEKPGRPNAPSGKSGKAGERDHLMTEKNPDSLPAARRAAQVDGFSQNRKPSKHQIKKEKKMARSKKKRRQKNPSISLPANHNGENGDVTEEWTNESSDTVEGGANDATPRKDEDSETNSDADIEDNLESDTSRAAMTSSQLDSSTGCHGDDEDNLSLTSSDSSPPEIVDHINGTVENMISDSDPRSDLDQKLQELTLEDSTNTEVNGDASSEQSTPKHQVRMSRRDAVLRSLTTLAPRYHPLAHECSVMSCLNQFTSAELLTGNNKFICKDCTKTKWTMNGKQGKPETVYTNASKQLLICDPPAVLTLHLKRFQQVGFSLRKVNRHVDFPLILDLAPYCSSLSKRVDQSRQSVKYSLYGAVEHAGRLSGGHYTAYVRSRHNPQNSRQFWQAAPFSGIHTPDSAGEEGEKEMPRSERPVSGGRWFYISDTHVKESSEHEVLKCQAYLLFYERVV